MTFSPIDFIRESNSIEGIHREPTSAEIEEFFRFMALETPEIEELVKFVKVYQPNARLRDKKHLDVRIGSHVPPPGGPGIVTSLDEILDNMHHDGAYITHKTYETLHPFTDGNGRSGRMLWMWMMRQAPLGFLHTWYYQSLSTST